jgi:hypothetical protein
VLELGGQTYLPLFQYLGCANTACANTAQHAHAGPRPPLDLGRVFDMVVCGIARCADAVALAMIPVTAARHASTAILLAPAECDAASTGAGESCPIAETLASFARLGWYPDLVDSLGMRALATWPLLRRALVLLRRGDRLAGEAAASVLIALDAKAPSFRASGSGVCHYAFSIAAPAAGQAGLMGW